MIVQYNYGNGHCGSEDDVCATALPCIMVPVRLSLMASVAPVSFLGMCLKCLKRIT